MQVVKRNNKIEDLDKGKILEVLEWACEGLSNVTPATVLLKADLHFTDGMTTSEIHDSLIKAASDLITELQPEYQYVAGRLLMTKLRKEVFGQHDPVDFSQHVNDMVKLGKYDAEVLDNYSVGDIAELGAYLDHDKDMNYTFAAMCQWRDKYLVKDRVTGTHYESPQQACMLIGMYLFMAYPPESRMDYVKRFYTAVSDMKVSLPTPIMAGVRTPSKQFSSCTKIEVGDSLDSINGGVCAVTKYSAARAGIGINMGRIRALNSPIRGGEAYHTGPIGFYKLVEAAMGSCSQGGVRKGSATVFYPWWHKDVESLLVLKNNKGTEESRARKLDYCIQFNKFFYQKVIKRESINLFCPNDVEGLYESFAEDQDTFVRLYERYSEDMSVPRKTVNAQQLMFDAMQERAGTGRVYIQNIDNCNVHGPFRDVAPVRQSNLCLEIALPTAPLNAEDKNEGEIALCTLAAFNLGAITLEELPELSDLLVRALDALLDYQDYPVKAAEKSLYRRSLGIGVINYAYFLAKNGVKYSDGSANNLTHRWFEAIQYNLLCASVGVAKEKGACHWFEDTKYSQGQLPIDWYNKEVDKLHDEPNHFNWEGLRIAIEKYGLRNSTLTALMPAECHKATDTLNFSIDGDIKEMSLREVAAFVGLDTDTLEGMCVPSSTLISKEVYVGEDRVEGVTYNGVHQTYNILLEDGTAYNLTGNHPVRVKGKGWVRVENLLQEDELVEISE